MDALLIGEIFTWVEVFFVVLHELINQNFVLMAEDVEAGRFHGVVVCGSIVAIENHYQ
jgi:hypothetical protein